VSESKKTKFMHGEISKLVHKGPSKGPLKGQKYSHKRAVAAALNVARDKGYDVGPKPEEEGMAGSVFDSLLQEKKLSYGERKKLKKGSFVFPGERRYPIEDKAHARNALARVSQHGSESEKAKVRAAVHKKFPGIGKEKDESVSVFDRFLGEGKMPAAFAKFIKKKAEGKKHDDDDDDDDDCMESVFDEIVTKSGGSRFNLIKNEQATPSSFDRLVGAQGASAFDQFVKPASAQAEALDDKLAKMSALTESLSDLKKKVLKS
jgi:hypothetical protein